MYGTPAPFPFCDDLHAGDTLRMGVDVTIVDNRELGEVKKATGVPFE